MQSCKNPPTVLSVKGIPDLKISTEPISLSTTSFQSRVNLADKVVMILVCSAVIASTAVILRNAEKRFTEIEQQRSVKLISSETTPSPQVAELLTN